VHPIERLRYVARSSGAPQDLLVRETAVALAAFHDDPTALVTACRRIVSRQLTSGALWWLCSRLLTAADPLDEARTAVAEIEADDTSRRLAAAIPEDTTVLVVGWQAQIAQALARRGDLDVLVVDTFGEAASLVRHLETRDVVAQEIPVAGVASAVVASGMVVAESTAFGPTGWIAPSCTQAAAAVAAHHGIPVWAVVGVGRVLPARVWDALVGRLDQLADPWDLDDEVVPAALASAVVGPRGVERVVDALARTDCPIAPELFKSDIT